MQTIKMKNHVYINSGYSIVGPLEGKGPLKEYFDYVIQDDTLKEKTFEKSERTRHPVNREGGSAWLICKIHKPENTAHPKNRDHHRSTHDVHEPIPGLECRLHHRGKGQSCL